MVAETIELPNIKKLFIPDPGHVIFDVDLDRADLQVVVWEASDEELKDMLREGVDIHSENARVIGFTRQRAKVFIHGTNYGGRAKTMARHCGITTHEADRAQRTWFQAHPGILRWHNRVNSDISTRRAVTNSFGFTRQFFGRIEDSFTEALAWIPQSTVSIVINKAILNVWNEMSNSVQLLLQVHDSFVAQIPSDLFFCSLLELHHLTLIPVPYPDPLIIPTGIKASPSSWGDCHELLWEAKSWQD